MALINATDLGRDFNLDQVADIRYASPFIYLNGIGPWDMAGHALAFAGIELCPVCRGKDLRTNDYCLGCDRSGLDGRTVLPGLPIDYAPDQAWRDDRQAERELVTEQRRLKRGA